MTKRVIPKPPISSETNSKRADGLENALSRKGSKESKSGTNYYKGSLLLGGDLIRDIYNSGGVGAKVITRIADDITRKGFSIDNDISGETLREFDRLKGTRAFNKAIRWARAYGGSLIAMTINDGQTADKPLRVDKIKTIEKLTVYEAGVSNNVSVLSKYTNAKKPNYNEPELYHINTGVGVGLKIHESRCIRLDGRVVDTTTEKLLDGWSGSELQPVYDSLMSMFSQMMAGEQVLDEMVIGTLKVENLDALCADSEGEEALRKRMDLVDKTKGNENSVVVDVNESYERHTTNLSGMSNIQQNAMINVAGSADIPATFLYGSSPDGQNATGASDEKQYYGKIDAERQYFYKPALIELLSLISGSVEIEITFPSLQTSPLYDVARSLDHVAKGIKALVESGVYSVEDGKKAFESTKLIDKVSLLQ